MSNTPGENRARFGVPENSMVFARGVRKSHGQLEVLKGVDFDVPTGSVACIIGPSGSGKSTFLRCINHLEKLTGGILLVDGAFVGYDLRGDRLYEVKDDELCQRRAEIGMLFQSFNLFSHMTVMENLIEAPIHVRRLTVVQVKAEAPELLARVGFPTRSTGMRENCRAVSSSRWLSPAPW